ncbi:MAG: phage tail tape measure protein [Paracoccaceae bacterium]
MDDVDALGDDLIALEGALGSTAQMVAAFDGELSRMRESLVFTGREIGTLSSGLSRGLKSAFDGVVLDGMKLSDALKGVAQSMVDTVYAIATRPIHDAVGGFLANGLQTAMSAILPFEKGAGFAQGRVMPFARGGVVASPTMFAMRGATGLMGEAGPEAIMPLARGADGRLGVQAAGGGRPVSVVMNITTPDAPSFQRSQGQIAAQMSRALSRGQRNR